jgi:phospholipase/carboxylesterase
MKDTLDGTPLSLIALHGVMSSPAELRGFADPLMAGFPLKDVRWIFPRGRRRPFTYWGGRPAIAWFDMRGRGWSRVDAVGIEEATRRVAAVIDAERRRGVPPGRIVLAGFSQGGALALHAGLRRPDAIGGIVAVSAALPDPDSIPLAGPSAPPVLLAHGVLDSVVPFHFGRHAERLLRSRGYRVEFRRYAIGHWVCPSELLDIADWLGRVVQPEAWSAPAPGKSSATAARPLAGDDYSDISSAVPRLT